MRKNFQTIGLYASFNNTRVSEIAKGIGIKSKLKSTDFEITHVNMPVKKKNNNNFL